MFCFIWSLNRGLTVRCFTFSGHYSIHFHMCEDVSDKEAVIKSNTIRNSYARAVTVHGTYGQTEDEPGVVVRNISFLIH